MSDALKCLIEHRISMTDFLTNYLDDFLFLAKLLGQCNYLMKEFILLCGEVGFPLSTDKTFWGSLTMVFLRILLNGQTLTLSIPLEKHSRVQELIQNLLTKRKATVKQLQQLCGFLNFLNRAIFPGHTFTRHMYAKFAPVIDVNQKRPGAVKITKLLKPHHHVRLHQEFKFDCKVWLKFLDQRSAAVVNRPMVDLLTEPTSAQDLGFYSDASAWADFGFSCVLKNHWIWGK